MAAVEMVMKEVEVFDLWYSVNPIKEGMLGGGSQFCSTTHSTREEAVAAMQPNWSYYASQGKQVQAWGVTGRMEKQEVPRTYDYRINPTDGGREIL